MSQLRLTCVLTSINGLLIMIYVTNWGKRELSLVQSCALSQWKIENWLCRKATRPQSPHLASPFYGNNQGPQPKCQVQVNCALRGKPDWSNFYLFISCQSPASSSASFSATVCRTTSGNGLCTILSIKNWLVPLLLTYKYVEFPQFWGYKLAWGKEILYIHWVLNFGSWNNPVS